MPISPWIEQNLDVWVRSEAELIDTPYVPEGMLAAFHYITQAATIFTVFAQAPVPIPLEDPIAASAFTAPATKVLQAFSQSPDPVTPDAPIAAPPFPAPARGVAPAFSQSPTPFEQPFFPDGGAAWRAPAIPAPFAASPTPILVQYTAPEQDRTGPAIPAASYLFAQAPGLEVLEQPIATSAFTAPAPARGVGQVFSQSPAVDADPQLAPESATAARAPAIAPAAAFAQAPWVIDQDDLALGFATRVSFQEVLTARSQAADVVWLDDLLPTSASTVGIFIVPQGGRDVAIHSPDEISNGQGSPISVELIVAGVPVVWDPPGPTLRVYHLDGAGAQVTDMVATVMPQNGANPSYTLPWTPSVVGVYMFEVHGAYLAAPIQKLQPITVRSIFDPIAIALHDIFVARTPIA